ncbi:MAG: hypothetical protein IT204_09380 [Fimbriimonadaceae bacterium]|nr:hypothetical protein [Fimbriimonadaceae bacterium]
MPEALPLSHQDLLAVRVPERHDPAVPTPAEVLGFAVGQRLARQADFQRYFATLAGASPRAALQVYGHSVEGRELLHLLVSSPANLARRDAVFASLRQLADPQQPAPELADLPVVTWIIANVHGGEHSSAEATLALAYELCAGQTPETARLLDESIVVIDPLQNPDGRDRSVNAYYSLHGVVANVDPHSAEHHCPWPGPRGSHYAFDLNRDWCLLTHPESRARVAAFLEQRPQVVADLHEMGNAQSFYFPPPAVPIEQHVATELRDWWEVFGRANAAAFDRRAWDYFVGEVFDSYYPGYGEAWPLFHGALGMTYEQAAAHSLAIRRRDGNLQTLADGAAQHFVAAYTTCLTAAEQRPELLARFRQMAVAAATPSDGRRALLIEAGDRAADAADLAANLRQQGIQVEQTAAALTVVAEPHEGGAARARTLAAGSLVIPLAQPAAPLVRALCDPVSPLPVEFVQQERDRLKWRAEPNIYDITAWSAPHRWDLEACWSADLPELPAAPPPTAAAAAGLAWIVPAGPRATYRLLCRLLAAEGWKVRVAQRPLTLAGRALGRGTLVLRVRDHGPQAGPQLAALAAECGAELLASPTAWTDEGLRLGSYYIRAVERPRIAVLTRPPVSAQPVGWLTYLLEQQYRLPYTPIDAAMLSAQMLAEYNVLVVTAGGPYERVFGSEASWLHAWVVAGGTLVALDDVASGWLLGLGSRFTTARRVTDVRPGAPADPVPMQHRPQRLAPLAAWVQLDPYSYLTYGCAPQMRVVFSGDRIIEPPLDGYTVARFRDREAVAEGFAPAATAAALDGRAYLWQERRGAGQVICFAEAPTFRASWPGLDRLWLNALLFGPSLRRE